MKSSNLIIPLSIVVAGMIIGAFNAGAIIYTSKTDSLGAAVQAPVVDRLLEPNIVTLEASPVTTEDHIVGSLSAPVKLIDYSDLECPFCKRHHNTLIGLSAAYDPSDFAWVYRHLPLDFHRQAMPQSIASECVARIAGNEAFWNFIGNIYEVTTSNDGLDMSLIPDFAREAGVTDMNAFNSCYEGEETRSLVEDDIADAANAGASGTPYSLVVSESEISTDTRSDIFDFVSSQNLEEYVYFAENGKYIGVSGALPQAAFEGIIDLVLAANN